MISDFLINAGLFLVVFLIFLPYTSKVIRLASRTWDERENLSRERVRQVMLLTPLFLVLAFLLVFLLLNALIDLFVFT